MTTTDSRTRSLIDVDVLEYHRLLTPEQQEKLAEIRAALAEIVTLHVAEAWSRTSSRTRSPAASASWVTTTSAA